MQTTIDWYNVTYHVNSITIGSYIVAWNDVCPDDQIDYCGYSYESSDEYLDWMEELYLPECHNNIPWKVYREAIEWGFKAKIDTEFDRFKSDD